MKKNAGWILLAGFLFAAAVAVYFGLNRPSGPRLRVIDALWAFSFVGFPAAGAVVIRRFPRRPLGWLLSGGPLLVILGVMFSEIGAIGLVDARPVYLWIYWASNILFIAGIGSLLFIPLLLPDGVLVARRWRVVVWTVSVYLLVAILTTAIGPWDSDFGENPLEIPQARWLFELSEALLGPVFFGALILGVIGLIVRFRRSRGEERQQVKALAVGALATIAFFGALAAIEAIFGRQNYIFVTLVSIAAMWCVPISIALAVRRHRLYDVDVIINRALVYGALTATLVGAYVAIVFALQFVLAEVTEDSQIAVAASTLAVAALFRPLRSQVQTFIDRRFYRRKYDAARSLEMFSTRLRNEVELVDVQRDVLATLGHTVQPAHASLWLRGVEVDA